MSNREKLIIKAALLYAAANREDLNDAFAAPCAYCGGSCSTVEAENDDAYCDGFAGDVDGLYADPEAVEIQIEGEHTEKIDETELKTLLEVFT